MDKGKQKKEKSYDPEITAEDRKVLGKKNLSMDSMQDRVLEDRAKPVDFTGSDLDVPGEARDFSSSKEIPDEENQLFSPGGERKDHLEERKDNTIDRNMDSSREAQ